MPELWIPVHARTPLWTTTDRVPDGRADAPWTPAIHCALRHNVGVSPFPSLGQISFTKFTSPEHVTQVLGSAVPGTTTATDVRDELSKQGQPDPLWNDLMAFDPPVVRSNDQPGTQVVVDNELLRACRDQRDDRFLLLWVALNLAEPRLDDIVRNILTDNDGHLRPEAVNGDPGNSSSLAAGLNRLKATHPDIPHDTKSVSNILSLLERCRLIVPTKHAKTITGIDRPLPTRHAVPGAVSLITERLSDRGIAAVAGREVDLALSLGANAWLNLSPDEFRDAFLAKPAPTAQSKRPDVPSDLVELATQLRRKGQVVLEGPPGAGKTYVARRYVDWSTAGRAPDSRLQDILDSLPANERSIAAIADEVQHRGLVGLWDIVQFHPGYDYTDFVRALVAQPHGSGVTFVAQHRILSMMAAIGAELEQREYDIQLVLVLDEINRGDIPNIFGELLYGLEYRGEAVATPYAIDGRASLSIPENLQVIGTMNTADRSIAVIDYALRRRFTFLGLLADDVPIRAFDFSDEVTREAALHLYAVTAKALEAAPEGLQVGPSYFLVKPDDGYSDMEVLAARFVYEVLPLLGEYEMEGELDQGSVDALRSSLGLVQGAPQGEQVKALSKRLLRKPWAPVVEKTEEQPPDEEGPVSVSGDQPTTPDEDGTPDGTPGQEPTGGDDEQV